MQVFMEQIINGLTIGSFYALVAMGYTMVYGVMKLINFAHGDLFALGSYIGYTILVIGAGWVTSAFGVWGGVFVAILGAMVGIGFAGLLLERVAYKPVYKAGRLPLVVSALGASIFISNGVMAAWGPRFQAYPQASIPTGQCDAVRRYPHHRAETRDHSRFLCTDGADLLHHRKTLFGAAVRASALDKDTATLMGVDFRKIIRFIFVGPAMGALVYLSG